MRKMRGIVPVVEIRKRNVTQTNKKRSGRRDERIVQRRGINESIKSVSIKSVTLMIMGERERELTI